MFHVYWPYSAALTMFILLAVIFTMIRYGPKLCKTRHHAKPDMAAWRTKTYEQEVIFT